VRSSETAERFLQLDHKLYGEEEAKACTKRGREKSEDGK
jgi:hypothetical protein